MPTQSLLVVANRTCPCPGLLDEVVRSTQDGRDVRVRIVAPALNTRLRHFLSDIDDAVAGARERVAVAVAALAEAGVHAEGTVGDADPVIAIEDELSRFDADEILISTHPPGESNWLATNLIERARERFDVPVVHLVSAYGLTSHPAA